VVERLCNGRITEPPLKIESFYYDICPMVWSYSFNSFFCSFFYFINLVRLVFMDDYLILKAKNIMIEIDNQLSNDQIDPNTARFLLQAAYSRISLLLMHIGYIESKYTILLENNSDISSQIINITAENQRLSSLIKY
jgi:hypothetical protein